MRNLIVVLLCIFTSAFAFSAQTEIHDLTVKVSSGFCRNNDVKFLGSGVVFRVGHQGYVVTSEHVLLQSNGDYCHHVKNNFVGDVNATLVSADWGLGLALLKVDLPEIKSVPQLDQLLKLNVSQGDKAFTSGYPYDSEDLVVDRHGYVLTAQSHRHLIPMITETIEVMDAHGEFGMSGGPVFADNENQIIGLLSHQYLALIPGSQSQVGVYSGSDQVLQNHLFVIPSAKIKEWVLSQITNAPAKPYFVRDPKSQLNKIPAIYTSGLVFIQKGGSGGIGGQGVGAGGQGVGAGGEGDDGGQGVGSGGDGTDSRFALLAIALDNNNHQSQWYLPSRQVWFEKVHSHLLASDKVTIPYFITRDVATQKLTRVRFHSLEEFFTLLQDSKLSPVSMVSSLNASKSSVDLLRLQEDGQVISSRAKALALTESDASSQLLLKRLIFVGEILSSVDDWSLVDATDLEALNPNRESWQDLFTNHYDDSVEILTRIVDATERLKQLKF